MLIEIISLKDTLDYTDLSHQLLLEQIEKKNIQIIYVDNKAHILKVEIEKAIPEDYKPF